jgi:hypothetical protein
LGYPSEERQFEWPGKEKIAHRYAVFSGGPPGIRTLNQWIKSPLLCR